MLVGFDFFFLVSQKVFRVVLKAKRLYHREYIYACTQDAGAIDFSALGRDFLACKKNL